MAHVAKVLPPVPPQPFPQKVSKQGNLKLWQGIFVAALLSLSTDCVAIYSRSTTAIGLWHALLKRRLS